MALEKPAKTVAARVRQEQAIATVNVSTLQETIPTTADNAEKPVPRGRSAKADNVLVPLD